MSIKEKEDHLFKKWKSKRPNLIPDGIIDEESFIESQTKVLYILKEVNGGKNWDLREYLRNGAQWKTWNNIVRWQYAIENLNTELKFSEVKEISSHKRKEILCKVSVLNIKKESGSAVSNMNEIWTYAWDDRLLINEQIELYSKLCTESTNPLIIICCGTGRIIQERGIVGQFKEWSITANNVKYKILNNCILIDYYHPQSRYTQKEELFIKLVNALKEIKLNQN